MQKHSLKGISWDWSFVSNFGRGSSRIGMGEFRGVGQGVGSISESQTYRLVGGAVVKVAAQAAAS